MYRFTWSFPFLRRVTKKEETPKPDLDAIGEKVRVAFREFALMKRYPPDEFRLYYRRNRVDPWLHVQALWHTDDKYETRSYVRYLEVRDYLKEYFKDEPKLLIPVYVVVRAEFGLKDDPSGRVQEGFVEVDLELLDTPSST